MESIFKIGDRVFDINYGWGNISYIHTNNEILVEFGVHRVSWLYTKEGVLSNSVNKTLSFTEYTLEGFSQERPEELPKRGNVVWIRDFDDEQWSISHFMKKNGKKYYCSDSMSEDDMYIFNQLTTKNPYSNE